MSIKRTLGQASQYPLTQIAAALSVVVAGPTIAYNIAADDLDKVAVVENTVTRDLNQRLQSLRSLSVDYNQAVENYKKILPYQNDSDYEARMSALKASGELEALEQRRDQLQGEYVRLSDDFKKDLVLSPSINEVTYGQFARLTPRTDLPGQKISLDGDGASLNECRLKYGQDVAATQTDKAMRISRCMQTNDYTSGWTLFISLWVFAFAGAGVGAGMSESRTLKRWAQEPKPKYN